MTTDTPRTDAYEFALLQFGIAPQETETDNNGPILSMNRHARTLERELACCRAECQRLRENLVAMLDGWDNWADKGRIERAIDAARAALQVTP